MQLILVVYTPAGVDGAMFAMYRITPVEQLMTSDGKVAMLTGEVRLSRSNANSAPEETYQLILPAPRS